MSDSNKHIEEFLNYYLEKESSPDYAVLITGCWGSGKTYFIKRYLGGEKKTVEELLVESTRYVVVYVSLFGVKNREDIDRKILDILKPELNNKKNDYIPTVGSLLTNIVGLTAGVAVAAGSGGLAAPIVAASVASSKALGDGVKYFSEKFIKAMEKGDGSYKKTAIVFDDVERTDLPLPELLGYLNEFVEHRHIPCILLADKDKWEEAQKCQKDKSTLHRLSSSKEKVIGKEFQIQTSFDEVWNYWDTEYNHPVGTRTWSIINKYRDLIRDIITVSGVRNYRSLKHVLSDCQRFIGENSNDKLYIKDNILKCDELTKLVLSDFICHQYAYYIGFLHPKDIPGDLSLYYAGRLSAEIDQTNEDDNQKEKVTNLYYEFIKKYDSIPRISDVSHNGASIKERSNDWNHIWKTWLETSFVDSKDVMNLMINSIFFNEKDAHNLNQLMAYNSLNDEEASKLWTELNEKFKKREFKNPNYVFTLFFQWLSLAYDGITEKNVDELFADMKEYIKEVTFDGSVFAGDQLPMIHEQLRNNNITKELLNMIGAKCPYDINAANKAVLNRLYSYMGNPSKNIDIPFTIKLEQRFPFEKIDVALFIDSYTKKEFREKREEMANCITSRLNMLKETSLEQYKHELALLNQLDNKINEILAQKPIPPSKLCLKQLKERITQIKKKDISMLVNNIEDPNAQSIHPGFTNMQLQAFLGIAAVAALEEHPGLTNEQFLIIVTSAISQVLGKQCRITAYKNIYSQYWTIVN